MFVSKIQFNMVYQSGFRNKNCRSHTVYLTIESVFISGILYLSEAIRFIL